MENTRLITEEQAVELFTFLITAARTQLDDPCLYGSMRLLCAAEMLRDFMAQDASLPTRKFLAATMEKTEYAQIIMNDVEAYTAALDELCGMTARYLVEQTNLTGGQPA
jgi:hypothetical protein